MDSPPILAYIDAGTGSLLLQFLIGGLLGLAFIGKMFWRNLVAGVGSLIILKMFWRNPAAGVGRLFGKKPAETTDDKDGAQE